MIVADGPHAAFDGLLRGSEGLAQVGVPRPPIAIFCCLPRSELAPEPLHRLGRHQLVPESVELQRLKPIKANAGHAPALLAESSARRK
ncbi:hypothetical protein KUV61_13845 [Nocardioides marinus]|nr:hypothetical protein [Nocardioides marinus]